MVICTSVERCLNSKLQETVRFIVGTVVSAMPSAGSGEQLLFFAVLLCISQNVVSSILADDLLHGSEVLIGWSNNVNI